MNRAEERRRRHECAEPLFVLGAARSGTSLVYKAICMHPDVAYISNWVRRFPSVPALAALNRLARRAPAVEQRVWFGVDSNAYVYGRRRPLWERAWPMPVEGEPVFARLGIVGPVAGTATAPVPDRMPALCASFAALVRYGGGTRVVSKRIGHNRRVPALLDAFPDARFLNIIRDGRAVAHSLSRVDWWPDSVVSWYGGTPRQWEAEGGDPWEFCARNWVEELAEVAAGLRHVPPAQVLEITYEGLVRAPVETLERVATFAGLRPSRQWLGRLGQLRYPNQNEGWRRLPPKVIERIESVQREQLRRHGYLSDPQEPRPSRARG